MLPRYIIAGDPVGFCFVRIVATLTHGTVSVALLILVLFFVCECVATIYTLGLRRLGRYTERGGIVVAATPSRAAVRVTTSALAMKAGNFDIAMAIPTSFCVAGWVFPCTQIL
jgi:fucose permease